MAGILVNNYDYGKTFLWNHTSFRGTYTNSTGSDVTLPKGRIMGRITVGQKLLPQVAAATDGSQQPIGVLCDDYLVPNGATVILTCADGGDVAVERLVYNGAETATTVITGDVGILQALQRNTQQKPRYATDLTGYDNAIS